MIIAILAAATIPSLCQAQTPGLSDDASISNGGTTTGELGTLVCGARYTNNGTRYLVYGTGMWYRYWQCCIAYPLQYVSKVFLL